MSKNNWRVNLVLAVIFIAGGIVLSRLFYLQINKGNYYKAMAQGQQMSIEDTTGERGAIYFAGGEPLALTERSAYVFISPDEISANDKENIADLLSKSLGIPESEILAKANISGSQYQIIQNDLTKEKAEEIKNLKLKGVYLDYKQIRSYPNKTMAAQLSGYLNKDGVGQYGVEGYYDNVLKGKSTIKKTASNPFNFFSGGDDDNINGSSLYLTVDYNIQYMAEKLLAKGVKDYDAKGGEIIVMDPATGAIIAMAQYPLFDPNNYQKEKNYDIFQNDSIQKIFEPGSIFKSVTIRGAISIAQRLRDPMAALVKIDPKSLGIGQYQHDVDQKQLEKKLHEVTEDLVNRIGVDPNSASVSLLSYVAGVGAKIAKAIVEHRESKGAFNSKSELLSVKGLGAKAYEQCAGFFRIREGKSVLDNTGVHPESYAIAQKLLASVDVKSVREADVPSLAKEYGVGEATLKDIVMELQKPGFDPRETLPPIAFRADLTDISELSEGSIVSGVVRNIADFGAFVDIGLKNDGLIHISQMSDKRIAHPLEVLSINQQLTRIRVLEVDKEHGKVSLSLKEI
jgi:competence ComEA-like helix-hairpin-helix protein